MTGKPMDPAAVLAASERIVTHDPEPPLFSMLEDFGHGDATRVYTDGQWWRLVVSEYRPGAFTFSWEPDPSFPA